MVVYFHLGEYYWKGNAYVSGYAFLQPLSLGSRPLHLTLTNWMSHDSIELGHCGVGLFFLISGFVIPFSLNKVGGLNFVIRRFFRIYPMYVAGLSLTTVSLLLSAHYSSLPFTYTAYDFAANATLLRDVFHSVSMDKVNWTLIVEVRFYLLCVLLYYLGGLGNWKTMGVAALLLCGLNELPSFQSVPVLTPVLGLVSALFLSHARFLVFMFIGVSFHNLFRGAWSPRIFGFMTGLFLLLFYVALAKANGGHGIGDILKGPGRAYPLMLVLFSLCYRYRELLRPQPFLNFFANVSYPLYVIHSTTGYALMALFFHWQHLSFLCFLEAFLILIFLAYLLHIYVEMPMNNLGYVLTSSKWKSR